MSNEELIKKLEELSVEGGCYAPNEEDKALLLVELNHLPDDFSSKVGDRIKELEETGIKDIANDPAEIAGRVLDAIHGYYFVLVPLGTRIAEIEPELLEAEAESVEENDN